jgi:hypothetical protein
VANLVYPIPSTLTATAKSYTVPNPLYQYKIVNSFDAGVYTITTSPTTSQATVIFYNSSGTIGSTTTISGTVSYNLSTAASQVYVSTNTGSNVVVTINKTAEALSGGALSGTLDTITTSGTYNQTGTLFVGAFGGGGGGGCGGGNSSGGSASSGTPGVVYVLRGF